MFSLLGVADEKQLLVLKQLINRDETVGLIGRDFWLIGDTLAESSLAGMELNWLWSGLLFCLVVLGKLKHLYRLTKKKFCIIFRS